MGWYSAVGRPAFFALPPEAAHRVANALLGLPIGWRRMGGVPDDASLVTTLAGIELRNPIGLAAGFDKSCAHLDHLGRLGFGYVVGGTITRAPRIGNPKPRIVRYPERGSMVNAMGLPNPGADAAARHLSRRPRVAPRLASIADEATADAVATFERLAPLADGVELNASCPNVSWGRDRDNEGHLADLLDAFGARRDTPVFVKLPPFAGDVEREVVLALARIAQEHGAAGLTCSNTRPSEEPRLSVGRGGVSGRDLAGATPGIVTAVREATGGALPVNACGGIGTPDDVRACLDAGAATVQIYTSLVFEGPGLVGRLCRGLIAGPVRAGA
jgi:dihydroorotate dehydrogenase